MKLAAMWTNRHFLAGLMFTAFGVMAIAIAVTYRFGTAARIGPGFFPVIIGGLIVTLGAAMTVSAARGAMGHEKVEPVGWRALLAVIASVLVFGSLVRSVGLIAAVAASVGIARLARPEGQWWEVLVLAGVLVVVAVFVFKYILNMSMPLVAW